MNETAHAALGGWESFYVIVGSSGAALIGLQFVVIALIKDTRRRAGSGTISAFGTPTVVHLGGALLISAVMSAPWPTLHGVAIALALCGVMGLWYVAKVLLHARHQTDYTPVLEDWLWHLILPCTAYGALTVAALVMLRTFRIPLFVIGAAALGLLLIAIHNAWDTVTYIVIDEPATERAGGPAPERETSG